MVESACSAGDPGSVPRWGRSPGEGNGNPLQYSCLENPRDGGAWQATVQGVAKSWTRLRDFICTFLSDLSGSLWGLMWCVNIFPPHKTHPNRPLVIRSFFFVFSSVTHSMLFPISRSSYSLFSYLWNSFLTPFFLWLTLLRFIFLTKASLIFGLVRAPY